VDTNHYPGKPLTFVGPSHLTEVNITSVGQPVDR
jgi:hypothetical protein